MGSRTSTLEINGNRYDAATGRVISTIKSTRHKHPKAIDGFVKSSHGPKHRRDVKAASSRHQHKSADFHRRTEKAHTLMRGGLKKPARRLHSRLQRVSSKPSPERELRAKTTPKHKRVDHFGNPVSSEKQDYPKAKALSGEVVSSGFKPSGTRSQASAAAPMPSMIASVSHQKLERLLDEALTKADAHKQALRYHAARHFWQKRWLNGRHKFFIIAILVLAIAVSAFVAWQRVPQLSMKVAGIQAHVSPAVPAYKPDGYTLASPAKSVSGSVTVKYKSKAEPDHSYDIVQSRSNLTSSLVAQNVVPKGASVQTSQVEGNTVYIYGSHNDATWVNNGVLFTIKNHADLSSDQLIQIVQGLNP